MRLSEPYFLYAFLALAIPVFIHLFSLQKHKTVYFSNVAFLKQIRQKKSHINKLQKLLLLLLRLLSLSAVILAFSEPYVSQNNELVRDKKIIGIYIDNSFSMNADNEKGVLIEQAKNNARNILNAHKGKDEFIFISNELQGKHQRILDHNDCLDAIDQTSIKAPVLNVSAVIDRWNALKQNEINAEAELYLISDFQKTSFSEEFYTQDSSFTTHLIPISSYPKTNLSIDTCYLESPNHSLGQQEWLYFEVSNESNKDLDNLSVKLIINGQQKALSTLAVKAHTKTTAKLSFNNHTNGTQKAHIGLTDATIPFDNRLYFNFDVIESNKVLCIHENTSNKALNTLFQDNMFDYSESNVGVLNLANLNTQDLIILESINNP
nr:BatA domain-containing protein [Flavobacteriales bacterium]